MFCSTLNVSHPLLLTFAFLAPLLQGGRPFHFATLPLWARLTPLICITSDGAYVALALCTVRMVEGLARLRAIFGASSHDSTGKRAIGHAIGAA